MVYEIVFEAEAEEQFRALTAKERKTVTNAVFAKLLHQPSVETHAIKRLRPNAVAAYQLAVGDLRLLYNIEGDRVIVLVVGRKVGNQLIVDGEEYREHQDDPAEPPGNGVAGDAE